MVVCVLDVEGFFEEEGCLQFEVADYLVVIVGVHQIFKLFQDLSALSRIEFFGFALQWLQSEPELQKFVVAGHLVNLNIY